MQCGHRQCMQDNSKHLVTMQGAVDAEQGLGDGGTLLEAALALDLGLAGALRLAARGDLTSGSPSLPCSNTQGQAGKQKNSSRM